jgi:hypothetical membrane protein
MQKQLTTLLLAGGASGPVLFWLVVIVDGFTEPGYDARKAFISELALGEHGWVQSANFVVVGLLMLGFAVGLRQLFSTGRASVFGPLLVGIFGLSLVASGIFPTDPANYPPGADTTTVTTKGMVHTIAFLIIIVSVVAGCFVFARRFRQEPVWQGYGLYSVITGILVPALLVVFIALGQPGQPYAGLTQRALVAVFFAWFEVIALRALRLTTSVPELAVQDTASAKS